MVPYGICSDFYYSGHCGFMMLNLMERYTQDRDYKMAAICAGFITYLMFILLIFRVHYDIDLPIGIAVAYCIYKFIERHTKTLDRLCFFVFCTPFIKYCPKKSQDLKGSRKNSATSTSIGTPLLSGPGKEI